MKHLAQPEQMRLPTAPGQRWQLQTKQRGGEQCFSKKIFSFNYLARTQTNRAKRHGTLSRSQLPGLAGEKAICGNLSHTLCIWLAPDFFPVCRDVTALALATEVPVVDIVPDVASHTDLAHFGHSRLRLFVTFLAFSLAVSPIQNESRR